MLRIRLTSACPGIPTPHPHVAFLQGWSWACDGWCLMTLKTASKYFNHGSIRLEKCVSHTVSVLLVCFYKLQMSSQRSEKRQSVRPMEFWTDFCPSGTFSHLRRGSLELSHRDKFGSFTQILSPPPMLSLVRQSTLAVPVFFHFRSEIGLKSESFLAPLTENDCNYLTSDICILVINTNISRLPVTFCQNDDVRLL